MIDRSPLIDGFGRRIDYVRLSVTDRCDLRCRYCMGEDMRFQPNADLLTFDEIVALADLLVARGVRRLRLTGGEPLVRRGILDLVARLGTRLGGGLDELSMTTNGTRLAAAAPALADAGVHRVNVSLDTLDPDRFRHITRRGDLAPVLAGIAAARDAGLKVKINMVALAGLNDDEFEPMLRWCDAHGHDLTLIETMPLGSVAEDRSAHYLSLAGVRSALEQKLTLVPVASAGGGPARTFAVAGLSARLGFITPLSDNFCASCNRIRIAATGTVYGCLGHDQKVELRPLLRQADAAAVGAAFDRLLAGKPRRHDFVIAPAAPPAVERHMSVTGG